MKFYMLLMALKAALLFFVPHFRTGYMALEYKRLVATAELSQDLDDYDFVCLVSDLDPGEEYDAMVLVRHLSWMVFCVAYYQLDDVLPFVNPNVSEVE